MPIHIAASLTNELFQCLSPSAAPRPWSRHPRACCGACGMVLWVRGSLPPCWGPSAVASGCGGPRRSLYRGCFCQALGRWTLSLVQDSIGNGRDPLRSCPGRVPKTNHWRHPSISYSPRMVGTHQTFYPAMAPGKPSLTPFPCSWEA